MIRTLIVDDEAPARDELKYLLSQEEGISIVGEADSGPEAIRLATREKPAVIFLDVAMRGLSGLETAVVLRTVVPDALIVFATAYDEYAVKAFEVGAVDYVLKPFEQARIRRSIGRIREYHPQEWAEAAKRVDTVLTKSKIIIAKLPVERNGKILLVDYDDIVYISTQSGSVTVVTAGDRFYYSGTLAELEERLLNTSLVRVHKSYIVNLDKVKEIIPWFKGTYWLKVEGVPDMEIPVSKSQIKGIKDILGLK